MENENGERLPERPIFGPATLLFVGRSPTAGMLPPHAWASQALRFCFPEKRRAASRQQFPNAHIEVLGYPHIAELALTGGLVQRVQSIEARALAGFFARNGELAEKLTGYFSNFDV